MNDFKKKIQHINSHLRLIDAQVDAFARPELQRMLKVKTRSLSNFVAGLKKEEWTQRTYRQTRDIGTDPPKFQYRVSYKQTSRPAKKKGERIQTLQRVRQEKLLQKIKSLTSAELVQPLQCPKCESLNRRLKDKQNAIQTLHCQLVTARQNIKFQEVKLIKLIEMNQSLNKIIDTLQKQISDLETQLQEKVKDRKDLEADARRLKEQQLMMQQDMKGRELRFVCIRRELFYLRRKFEGFFAKVNSQSSSKQLAIIQDIKDQAAFVQSSKPALSQILEQLLSRVSTTKLILMDKLKVCSIIRAVYSDYFTQYSLMEDPTSLPPFSQYVVGWFALHVEQMFDHQSNWRHLLLLFYGAVQELSSRFLQIQNFKKFWQGSLGEDALAVYLVCRSFISKNNKQCKGVVYTYVFLAQTLLERVRPQIVGLKKRLDFIFLQAKSIESHQMVPSQTVLTVVLTLHQQNKFKIIEDFTAKMEEYSPQNLRTTKLQAMLALFKSQFLLCKFTFNDVVSIYSVMHSRQWNGQQLYNSLVELGFHFKLMESGRGTHLQEINENQHLLSLGRTADLFRTVVMKDKLKHSLHFFRRTIEYLPKSRYSYTLFQSLKAISTSWLIVKFLLADSQAEESPFALPQDLIRVVQLCLKK